MSGPVDRDYLDARFDGLKELMQYQQANTTAYIQAVSNNVKGVAADLRAHQESIDPHGRRATDRLAQNAVAWLGLVVASIVAAFEFRKN